MILSILASIAFSLLAFVATCWLQAHWHDIKSWLLGSWLLGPFRQWTGTSETRERKL